MSHRQPTLLFDSSLPSERKMISENLIILIYVLRLCTYMLLQSVWIYIYIYCYGQYIWLYYMLSTWHNWYCVCGIIICIFKFNINTYSAGLFPAFLLLLYEIWFCLVLRLAWNLSWPPGGLDYRNTSPCSVSRSSIIDYNELYEHSIFCSLS